MAFDVARFDRCWERQRLVARGLRGEAARAARAGFDAVRLLSDDAYQLAPPTQRAEADTDSAG